jgi:hypothetical protein
LLEKNTRDRFQSPTELADLLEQYLAHVQQPTNAPLPRFSWRIPSATLQRSPDDTARSKITKRRIAAMLALMLLAGGIASYPVLMRGRPAQDSAARPQSETSTESKTSIVDSVTEPSIFDQTNLEWDSMADEIRNTSEMIENLENSAAEDLLRVTPIPNDSLPSKPRDEE